MLGPLVKVASFRTTKEAVAIINHSTQGVGCSVWSEKNSLIMQVRLFLFCSSNSGNGHYIAVSFTSSCSYFYNFCG